MLEEDEEDDDTLDEDTLELELLELELDEELGSSQHMQGLPISLSF